ncbi:MAG: hypothetical protein AB7T38_10540 [Nitrospirales bacterium]
MLKVQDAPPVLDEAEKAAVKEFVEIIAGTDFSSELVVLFGGNPSDSGWNSCCSYLLTWNNPVFVVGAINES